MAKFHSNLKKTMDILVIAKFWPSSKLDGTVFLSPNAQPGRGEIYSAATLRFLYLLPALIFDGVVTIREFLSGAVQCSGRKIISVIISRKLVVNDEK